VVIVRVSSEAKRKALKNKREKIESTKSAGLSLNIRQLLLGIYL
jgi:hypothetical protein